MPKFNSWMVTLALLAFPAALAACGADVDGALGSDEPSSIDSQSSEVRAGKALYLGLGDSITFGDNSFIPYTPEARPNDDEFRGFADSIGRRPYHNRYYNLGCPGETTGSFFDVNAEDNGCKYVRANLPLSLHYPYGTRTQLEETLFLLEQNRGIQAITLTLGGNDLLLLQKRCVAATPQDPGAIQQCLASEAPTTVASAVSNLGNIVYTLRSQAQFSGRIVFVNNYAPNYRTLEGQLIGSYNQSVAQNLTQAPLSLEIADAYSAFQSASADFEEDACAAGLLVPNPVQPPAAGQAACDYHPSAKGRHLLAATTRAILHKKSR